MGSVFVMECVMTVYDILQALEGTSSRNEKIAMLQANANNEVLKQVIVYALDPFKNFYIRKIPQYKIDEPTMLTLENALPKLDKLISRHTGRLLPYPSLNRILYSTHRSLIST